MLLFLDRKKKSLKVIKGFDPNVNALLYPLFFPKGASGYNINMKKTNESGKTSRLTMREYYSHQLQMRDNSFFILKYGGMLTQKYIIDIFTRIEHERLEFHRKNQASLKIAKYKTLMDSLGAEQTGISPGMYVVLPSTYQGSPRNMVTIFLYY